MRLVCRRDSGTRRTLVRRRLRLLALRREPRARRPARALRVRGRVASHLQRPAGRARDARHRHVAHAPRGAGPRRPERRPAHRRHRPASRCRTGAPCCACATTSRPRSCSRAPTGPTCARRGPGDRDRPAAVAGGRVDLAPRRRPAVRARARSPTAARGRRRRRRAAGLAPATAASSRRPTPSTSGGWYCVRATGRSAGSTASSSACSARSPSSSGRPIVRVVDLRTATTIAGPAASDAQARSSPGVGAFGHARPAPPRAPARARRRSSRSRRACPSAGSRAATCATCATSTASSAGATSATGALVTARAALTPAAPVAAAARRLAARRPAEEPMAEGDSSASMQGPSSTTRTVTGTSRRRAPVDRVEPRAQPEDDTDEILRAPRRRGGRPPASVARRARAGGRVRPALAAAVGIGLSRRRQPRRIRRRARRHRQPGRARLLPRRLPHQPRARAVRAAPRVVARPAAWRKIADLDAGGGAMGTLRALPGGGFLLAYEAQRPTQPNGKVATNVRLRLYRDGERAAARPRDRGADAAAAPEPVERGDAELPRRHVARQPREVPGPARLSLARPRAEAAGRSPGAGHARRGQVVGVEGTRASTARCRGGVSRQPRRPPPVSLPARRQAVADLRGAGARERHRLLAGVPLRRRRAQAQAPGDPHAGRVAIVREPDREHPAVAASRRAATRSS